MDIAPGTAAEATTEQEIRRDLAAAYRAVAMFGWDDLVFTHLSARIPGPEHHFLINPYGLLFEEITASNLIKVGLDGEKLEESEYNVNPAGFTIHSAVHEAREDAMCVMHLHTLDGCGVAAMDGGLQPVNQTSMLVLGDLAYHEYEGVALDHDERPRLVGDLGSANMMLLWNHGTLALGGSVGEAFSRMYYLERACSMQVRAVAGGKTHAPSTTAREKTAELGMILGSLSGLVWPAIVRKLDRLDPSYRD
jgi:ribulose-5-phosphate 4-epimerase/fuculose-1-phosphate aldolase